MKHGAVQLKTFASSAWQAQFNPCQIITGKAKPCLWGGRAGPIQGFPPCVKIVYALFR